MHKASCSFLGMLHVIADVQHQNHQETITTVYWLWRIKGMQTSKIKDSFLQVFKTNSPKLTIAIIKHLVSQACTQEGESVPKP